METADYEARRRANILDNQRILREIGLINPFKTQKLSIKRGVKRKSEANPVRPKRPCLEEKVDTENCGSIIGNQRRSARIQGQPTPSKDEIKEAVEEWLEDDRENRHIPVPKNRPNTYGAIEGVDIGTVWDTRMECCRSLIHRPPVSGIHAGPDGAYSVALSGGYDDNIDWGECFTYTGEGGRDLKGTAAKPKNLRMAPQSKDQTLTRGNLALSRNVETGQPVRVIRGYKLNSPFAPEEGYRYDGLYKVEKAWYAAGVSGFMVWKFALSRLKDQAPPPWQFTETSSSQDEQCVDTVKVEEDAIGQKLTEGCMENMDAINTTKVNDIEKKDAINTTEVNDIGKMDAINTTEVNDIEKKDAINTTEVNDIGKMDAINTTEVNDIEKKDAINTTEVNDIGKKDAINTTEVNDIEKKDAINTTEVNDIEKKNAINITDVNDIGKKDAINTTEVNDKGLKEGDDTST